MKPRSINPEAAALGRRARDIFLEAVALEDNSARAAYVTSACAGTPALLAEVEALLNHDQPDDFLEVGPARFGPAPGLGTVEAEQPGGVLGHYQLIEKLGEGGFGDVWAAQQSAPVRRRVALKIIKLGMDTKQVVGRFEAERQALALMDHPSIAKVLDAGATERGRPYFVMELVPGIRITDYCEQNQLPTKARLDLFIQVCQAIQHAHQKGIIHRDIKPSNILVTQHDRLPLPKVIDFGIAKATLPEFTEATVFTQSSQLIGTPAYMSPEQAAMTGLDVDTRSDIYSLGVLLYELLTGSTPFDTKELVQSGMERMRKIIREREPLRPSARLTHGRGKPSTGQGHASPEIDSDLDWIVMKCLEKDRTRRYETANGLAADLKRHLAHEPVVARPPSAAYRFRKAWQRNRLVFAAGAAVFAALALGLGLAIHGLLQARAERANADQARLAAQQQRRVAEEQERLAKENAQRATEAQKDARRALARAQIALADAAYQNHDGPSMERFLAEVPEDLRDSSWSYLRGHADTSLARLQGFLVGAAPHPLRPGVFAVAEQAGGIALVDAATGQRLREIDLLPQQRAAQFARGLAVSPDGRRLAVGCLGRGGLAIYELESGRPPIHWEAAETDRLEFSPDGRTLLQSSNINREVSLWDPANGRLLWRIPDAWRAVFHPSGAQVITTHGAALVVLAVKDGSVVRQVAPLRTEFLAMAVSPDGRLVVIGERDGHLRAVDLVDGRVVFERPGHDQLVRFVEFTPDGSRFASVADEGGSRQSIQVWQAGTGAHLQSILGGSSAAESLRFHPLTHHLLVTGPASRTWALRQERPVRTYPGGTAMAFFSDEQSGLIATTGQGIQTVDFDSADPNLTWGETEADVWSVTASADGLVAAASRAGTWTSQTTVLRRVAGATKETRVVVSEMAVSFARLSPNGDRLVTFVPGGVCSGQFNTRTGEPLANLDTTGGIMEVHDAVWLNETQVVGVVTAGARRGAAGSEEWLVLWDAASGRRLQTVTCDSIIRCLAPAPDGRRFAEAGEDKMIRIREAASLGIQGEFRAHDSAVTSLAWSRSRPVLASASADLTIKLWDQPTTHCLAELRGPSAPAISLSFSPSGRRLISAGSDAVRLWAPAALR